jgi:hypothetical protein
MTICRIDSGQYFLCNFEDIKSLAELIDHIPVKLKSKYIFATSPINRKEPYLLACFVKFVRSYSNNEPVTVEMVKKMVEWPFQMPKTLSQIKHLEIVYDVFDLYLWLSNRFHDIFCYEEEVKQMRTELEKTIYLGVQQISKVNMENGVGNRHSINRNLHRHSTSRENINKETVQIKNMFNLNQYVGSNATMSNSQKKDEIKAIPATLRSETINTRQDVTKNLSTIFNSKQSTTSNSSIDNSLKKDEVKVSPRTETKDVKQDITKNLSTIFNSEQSTSLYLNYANSQEKDEIQAIPRTETIKKKQDAIKILYSVLDSKQSKSSKLSKVNSPNKDETKATSRTEINDVKEDVIKNLFEMKNLLDDNLRKFKTVKNLNQQENDEAMQKLFPNQFKSEKINNPMEEKPKNGDKSAKNVSSRETTTRYGRLVDFLKLGGPKKNTN